MNAVISNAQDGPGHQPLHAVGKSFIIHEWKGSGPPYLHVHYEDDEAWHVLEGRLTFRIGTETLEAGAGTTVFVPAGVPHTYYADEDARYLVILTPKLDALIRALQASPLQLHASILQQYRSAMLDNQ